MIQTYYNNICAEWGVTPTSDVYTGYEGVEKDLRRLSKERWAAADEAGRLAIEQEVFDIYRTVNVLPLTYYSLEGCRAQIRNLAHKNKSVTKKTLAIGGNDGNAFARFWFPNMQDARWNTNDTVSLRSRFNHDTKFKRAIKLCYQHRDNGDEAVFPHLIRTAIELVNGGTIQNFKPLNARAVWEYLCPTFMGNLLDFSSGYGGRMLGSMTSRMRYHYTGIDPNTRTFEGLQALGELLQDEGQGSGFSMNCMPSEEFVPEPGTYDAAFSSPPYFNLETYTDEPTQCMNRYSDIDRWFEGYVAPTLKMIHRALADDGVYAVNIADYKHGKEQFKIVERWIELSEKCGFKHTETLKMLLTTRPGVGNNRSENSTKFEGIFVFKK